MITIRAALASLFFLTPQGVHAFSTINFSLTLDAADAGIIFKNFHEGQKGTADLFAVAFNTQISLIDGTGVSLGKIASFCTELQEDVSTTSYQFQSHPLEEVSAGRAGQAGTASVGIPVGGIGTLRAAQVRYLFDHHYQSSKLSNWTITTAQPLTEAFQIALWELTHDTDFSLTRTSGITYMGTQTEAKAINALNIATGWLNEIAAANLTVDYTSTTFDVWTLVSATGNTSTGYGFQDILFATTVNDSRKTTLQTMSVIPEPSAAVLGLLTGAALGFRRRRLPPNRG
ncbi:MAG: hypothetical protein JWL81_1073 [Verrucomicrobiales bacterium]|nr:hypothetical protein [Verrucomicrobiales bacterium]